MADIILLETARAERLARRGTGFAYCPPPTWLTQRAYERQCVYAGDVLIFMALGLCGAAWIIGTGVWSAISTLGHVGAR